MKGVQGYIEKRISTFTLFIKKQKCIFLSVESKKVYHLGQKIFVRCPEKQEVRLTKVFLY